MLENQEGHHSTQAWVVQANRFLVKQVVNETISIYKWVSLVTQGSSGGLHNKPSRSVGWKHSFLNCSWVEDLDGRWERATKEYSF